MADTPDEKEKEPTIGDGSRITTDKLLIKGFTKEELPTIFGKNVEVNAKNILVVIKD